MIVLIFILILLLIVLAVMALKIYTMGLNCKKLKSTSQRVNALSILQDFLEIIGNSSENTQEKMNKINETLIEKYEIKYSTIVVFDGTNYNVEASNVSEKHWKMFKELHTQEIFMESIKNATPKYVTVKKEETLPYLDMEFERAKSAIFFPLYVDNVYIGYWLIEGSQPHEFDANDTTLLNVIKNNITYAIRIIKSQRVLENLARIDTRTGLYTYEYLLGSARKVFDKYPTSIVSLIKITNLAQIEEKISKKVADAVLNKFVSIIKSNLSTEYLFVKYSENEYAIVFSGIDIDGVGNFLEDLKNTIEKTKIKIIGAQKESMNGLAIASKLNIYLTSYYKETSIESVLSTLGKYLNNANSEESDITCV